MKQCVLLCGYKRTGKDEFYKSLTGEENSYTWKIYKDPDVPRGLEKTWFPRFAFADELKNEINRLYKISEPDDKDKRQFSVDSEILSYRDICKIHSLERKKTNNMYWASFLAGKPEAVVTDWRFQNEYSYCRNKNYSIKTVRIFRSDVPLPAPTDFSEHELDQFSTDYLALPDSKGEFQKCCEIFPQYSHFIFSGYL